MQCFSLFNHILYVSESKFLAVSHLVLTLLTLYLRQSFHRAWYLRGFSFQSLRVGWSGVYPVAFQRLIVDRSGVQTVTFHLRVGRSGVSNRCLSKFKSRPIRCANHCLSKFKSRLLRCSNRCLSKFNSRPIRCSNLCLSKFKARPIRCSRHCFSKFTSRCLLGIHGGLITLLAVIHSWVGHCFSKFTSRCLLGIHGGLITLLAVIHSCVGFCHFLTTALLLVRFYLPCKIMTKNKGNEWYENTLHYMYIT